MAKFMIEYNEHDIKDLILKDLENKMSDVEFTSNELEIMVKSKQNYRQDEWEKGQYKCVILVIK